MVNVLIVATQPQRFLDLLVFSEKLTKQTKEIELFFFIGKEIRSCYADKLNDFQFQIINNIAEGINDRNSIPIIYKIRFFLKNIISEKQKRNIIRFLFLLKGSPFCDKSLKQKELDFLRQLRRKFQIYLPLVKKNHIDVFLMDGDRHLLDEQVFLKISKKLHITNIIPYLVDFSDKERILKGSPKFKKIKRKWFVSKYIQDSQEKLGYKTEDDFYYYVHPIANALKKFGVLTENPFVMGCGESDILSLNNKNTINKYIAGGVKESKIRLIGDFSYDALYASYNNKRLIKKNY